jgi:hypothetical protein
VERPAMRHCNAKAAAVSIPFEDARTGIYLCSAHDAAAGTISRRTLSVRSREKHRLGTPGKAATAGDFVLGS